MARTMVEPYSVLNGLSTDGAREALTRCCGSTRWVEAMLTRRPYASSEALYQAADAVWSSLHQSDYLEAFSHHPQIGADVDTLRQKFRATARWSSEEQASVGDADAPTLIALRDENALYLARFGFIFIVCATGKSATEMLQLLRSRVGHTPSEELGIAAQEQAKITRLRLQKLTF